MKFTALTAKQKDELLGLFYWMQQLQWALYYNEEDYKVVCQKNVEFNIEMCDRVGVPFIWQNEILTKTTRHSTYEELLNLANKVVQI